MGYRYAVNSSGEVLDASRVTPVHITPLPERTQELQNLRMDISEIFQNEELLLQPTDFDIVMQPFYQTEKLVFFTRERIEASDPRVRQSVHIRENPDYHFKDESLDKQLRSIFPVKEGGHKAWYILSAEIFAAERNLTDGNYIQIQASVPVLYHQFLQDLSRQMISREELNQCTRNNAMSLKYTMESLSGRDYQKPEKIAETALDRITVYPDDRMDSAIDKSLDFLYEKYGIHERDAHSNQKMVCLHQICDGERDVVMEYELYTQIKRFLKQQVPGTNGICYKENAIFFRMPEEPRGTIFIANPKTKLFNAGGTTIRGIETLKTAILNKSVLHEKDWFQEIKRFVVQPDKEKKTQIEL